MMNNDEKLLAQKLRKEYAPEQIGPAEELKKLDRRVKRLPVVFACLWGSISALILGAGMSLVMTDISAILGISNPNVIGISLGLVGVVLMLLTWPVFKSMRNRRRKKYAPRILALSQAILEREV